MKNKNEHNLRSIGKNALVLTLLSVGGKLLANVIINSATGVFAGHIDASCAADVNCASAVLESVKNLPFLVPALYGLGSAGKFVINKCSTNPDGGTNLSIKGKVE